MAELTKLTFIQYLCEKKLRELGFEEDKNYISRLERELTNVDVQEIQDYVLNLLKANIKVDTHHSLMYFLLGVSATDPIKEGIDIKIKKQSSFPDIDTDFSVNEREQVIKYFINKYGNDHVAPIGSYGQMKMKMVIRDIARIYDVDIHDTNEVAKNLQDDVDSMSEEEFDIILEKEPGQDGFRNDMYELRRYFERHSAIRDIIFKLKGQLRHLTKHPAGVVATPGLIDESIPLMKHKDELITSWVDGIMRKDLQSSGFIKFDILGLKTLTIVKEILELIISRKAFNKDADFDIEELDYDRHTSLLYEDFSSQLPLDGNTVIYDKFQKADTNGIFQFECIVGDTWVGNSHVKEIYDRFCEDPAKVHKIASINLRQRAKVRQKISAMSKKVATVYRLIVGKNNMCIEATLLHEFYTLHGWKTLGQLLENPDEYVMVDRGKNRYQYYCERLDKVLNNVGVGRACRKCVRVKERICTDQRLTRYKTYRHRYKFVKINSITFIGEKEVFDLGFEDDPSGKKKVHHNYIANGFVVHNSALMRSLLKEIKPTSFADITSATALGRPGPLDMGMHKEYAARKNGKSFDYGSKSIEKCLKESYGILVYQEDVMRLCNMVAGFPLDLTDTVRKNLMKSVRDGDAKDKAAKERVKIHDMFIKGFAKNDLQTKVAESWWQNCISFARYGFNKCLTGDTVLTRCNGNQHTERNVTIKDLYFVYRSKTPVGKKYRRSGYPKIHAMVNGRIKLDKIKNIVFNGPKPVFRIITENNFKIKSTDIHRFLSEFGWKMLKDFSVNDLIAVTFQEYDGYDQKGYSNRVEGKTYTNYIPGFGEEENNPAWIDGRSILKHKNIQKLKQKYKTCQECNKPHNRLEVHHKQRLITFDYDLIKYHDESNLCVLCPSCHKKKHYEQGRAKRYEKGFEITYDKIVSIEYVGIEDTYDIEMYGDEHNFVANGFISHNSHAVAYTVLSYQMMWFKVYYPLEFYVVLFSNSLKEKFANYFAEAMNKGINIVPADINKAKDGFTIHSEENSIMFGIGHIMGVGPAVVNNIMQVQPFESFEDFYEKTSQIKKIPKGAMEALINAHVFDCFGTQNELLEKYFIEIRKDKDWQREVDYEDKKFEHEKFMEAYSLDWRTKLSDDQKAEIKRLEAKLLTKFVQPKINTKRQAWGIITEVIKKTSKNGNEYFYVVLTDSKFNIVKVRIPTYNRRCKKAFLFDRDLGKYKKVVINDVIQVDYVLVGEVETSEYMGRIFVDMYDICCLGSVYEKTLEQKQRLEKYDQMFEEN